MSVIFLIGLNSALFLTLFNLFVAPKVEFNVLLILVFFGFVLVLPYRFFYGSQFVFAAGAICIRFCAVNKLCDNLSAYQSQNKQHAMIVKVELKQIVKIYHKLCDGIEIVNKTFTFHFILLFPLILVTTVFTTYGIVLMFLSNSEITAYYFCVNIILSINYLIFMIVIMWGGSEVTKESEKTKIFLSKIMNKGSFTSEEKMYLILVIMQMKSRNLHLQSHFFKLNWHVLLSVS